MLHVERYRFGGSIISVWWGFLGASGAAILIWLFGAFRKPNPIVRVVEKHDIRERVTELDEQRRAFEAQQNVSRVIASGTSSLISTDWAGRFNTVFFNRTNGDKERILSDVMRRHHLAKLDAYRVAVAEWEQELQNKL